MACGRVKDSTPSALETFRCRIGVRRQRWEISTPEDEDSQQFTTSPGRVRGSSHLVHPFPSPSHAIATRCGWWVVTLPHVTPPFCTDSSALVRVMFIRWTVGKLVPGVVLTYKSWTVFICMLLFAYGVITGWLEDYSYMLYFLLFYFSLLPFSYLVLINNYTFSNLTLLLLLWNLTIFPEVWGVSSSDCRL